MTGDNQEAKPVLTQEAFDELQAKYKELWTDFGALRAAVSNLGKQVDGLNISNTNVMLKLPRLIADMSNGRGIMPAIEALQLIYSKMDQKYG